MEYKINTVIWSDDSLYDLLKTYFNEFGLNSVMRYNSQSLPENLNNDEKYFFVVDITTNPDEYFDTILNIKKCVPTAGILILSEDPSVDLIMKSMRAGANEFLSLPLIKSELINAVNKILSDFNTECSEKLKCKIISVFSNKGGIGKTSVASNLALSLSRITKEPIALVDLNFQSGDVTTFLDLKPAFNLSYMLENLNKINQDFLFSTIEKYRDTSLYVLANTPDFNQTANVSPSQVVKLLKALKQTFSYIIIDMEAGFDLKNTSVLDLSDYIFLVAVANLPALRNTQRCLELFNRLGLEQNKVQLILNRFMENDEIGISDIEKLLNKNIYWKIPNNYFTIMSAINKGIPVVDLNPDSNVAKNYKELSLFIAGNIYKENVIKKYERILK